MTEWPFLQPNGETKLRDTTVRDEDGCTVEDRVESPPIPVPLVRLNCLHLDPSDPLNRLRLLIPTGIEDCSGPSNGSGGRGLALTAIGCRWCLATEWIDLRTRGLGRMLAVGAVSDALMPSGHSITVAHKKPL